jgi:predicted CXXCH cytochrome family protein
MTGRGWLASGAAILAIGVVALVIWRGWPQHDERTAAVAATYVGSSTCAECHGGQAAAWRTSQHAKAMAPATAETVLASASEFFTRDQTFHVHTAGPDGNTADFPVAYTFGLFPLQQYLIPLPGGRLQAFRWAWDARDAKQGGQRWFDLYPNERLEPGDPLHWTGSRQNWNFMCADCHATNLRKGYDPDAREFHTTWSELGAGCESCHGPGSAHVAAARAGTAGAAPQLTARLDERRGVRWRLDPATGQPARSQPRIEDREIDVCARCHSRRSQMTDAVQAGDGLEQAFRPSLIEPALFYPDGQQKDEVYTYASFLQSRMYAAGVTCSDCHDPHTGATRLQGNALCTQCHTAATYDSPAHHFHGAGTEAASCVTCHLPVATFMRIDRRHDHSLRVPRPDRAEALGVPDVCTSACHAGKGPAWAAGEIPRRTGRAPGGFQTFAEALAAAERGAPDAANQLSAIARDARQPAIVRGSALERLAPFAPIGTEAAIAALADRSPLVRRSAIVALGRADDATRLRALPPLLADPVRTVRVQAATTLADLADQSLPFDARASYDRAFDEFLAEQRFNADRPEAQTNLGQVLLQRSRLADAVAAFTEAIRLDRTFLPAYIDLADARRLQQNEPAAERVLRDAIAIGPPSAAVHHALGLALVRQRRMSEALEELARAAALEPETSRYGYVYAVALHDAGRAAEAVAVLESVVRRHPEDRESQLALSAYRDEAVRGRQ